MSGNEGGLIPPRYAAVEQPALDMRATAGLTSLRLPHADRNSSILHLVQHLLANELTLVQLERKKLPTLRLYEEMVLGKGGEVVVVPRSKLYLSYLCECFLLLFFCHLEKSSSSISARSY